MQKRKYILIIVCIMLFVTFVWYFFFDMNHLPVGKLIFSSTSPGGEYIVNVFICEGNATVANSIRAEVTCDNMKRNIYWQYDDSLKIVEWISNDVININGVHLDIHKDKYDWRRK